MLRTFEIHRVDAVGEAADLLRRLGDEATLYAGGTELLQAMKHGLLRYRHLIDVKGIGDLRRLEIVPGPAGGALFIGAAVTHRALETAAGVRHHLPALAAVERRVANVRVRTAGTLGGNLCFADPHSDPATFLGVLDAEVILARAAATRTLPLEAFVLDAYATAREPDEVLVAVTVPVPAARDRIGYQRVQFHERPTAAVAVRVTVDAAGERIERARAVAGCVNPAPVALREAEAALAGVRLDRLDDVLQDAAQAARTAVDPVDDLEGPADYKRHLIGVLLRRAVQDAVAPVTAGEAHAS
jgi:carbon-monoxide dehydrogenase medium subunit